MLYLLLFCYLVLIYVFFVFKQKTAYEMRISDWSSDVCSSDLGANQIGMRKRTLAMKWRDLLLPRGRLLADEAERLRRLEDFFVQAEFHGSRDRAGQEIGRASCRERGCQYG